MLWSFFWASSLFCVCIYVLYTLWFMIQMTLSQWIRPHGPTLLHHPPLNIQVSCTAVKETELAIRRLLFECNVSYDTADWPSGCWSPSQFVSCFYNCDRYWGAEKNKTVGTLAETSRKVGKEGEPSAQPHTKKPGPQNEGDGQKKKNVVQQVILPPG